MNRREIFREACSHIAFAADGDDPSADLIAIGYALQLIGNDLRGKPAAEQRARITAAQLLADQNREGGKDGEGHELQRGQRQISR